MRLIHMAQEESLDDIVRDISNQWERSLEIPHFEYDGTKEVGRELIGSVELMVNAGNEELPLGSKAAQQLLDSWDRAIKRELKNDPLLDRSRLRDADEELRRAVDNMKAGRKVYRGALRQFQSIIAELTGASPPPEEAKFECYGDSERKLSQIVMEEVQSGWSPEGVTTRDGETCLIFERDMDQ